MPSLLSRICSLIEIRLLSNTDDCNSFLLFPLDWKTPAIPGEGALHSIHHFGCTFQTILWISK